MVWNLGRPTQVTFLRETQTIRNFKDFAASIESVYVVEASPGLRETQKKLLCGDAPMEEIDIGFRSHSKYANLPVTWCEDIRFVPNSKDPVVQHMLKILLTAPRSFQNSLHIRP